MSNKLTDREQWDIKKILGGDDFHYATMDERHRTAAVSLVAVFASASNLEYVPDTVLNRDICRMALSSSDANCTILPLIPFPDIQKEGIKKFSSDGSAFVVHSFVDISDAQMAHDAVKANAYCLQLVHDKLITVDLCKTALQHTEADKKVLEFIPERFRNNPELKILAEEKFGEKSAQKEMLPPLKRKNLFI